MIDSEQLFFEEQANHELLSRAEERDLIEQAISGGPAVKSKAIDRLVECNQRLVLQIAKKYLRAITNGVPSLMDLIQEGNMGLLKAIDRFDLSKNCRFSTYSTWWIRQAITRALVNQGRLVRLPVHQKDLVVKYDKIHADLKARSGEEPAPAEVAKVMGKCPERMAELIRMYRLTDCLSLDFMFGDDDYGEMAENLHMEDRKSLPVAEACEHSELSNVLDKAIRSLTFRQAQIIELRNGLNGKKAHTLQEAGDLLGLTRERIRQIEKEALARLRHPCRSRQLRDFL